MPPSSDGPPSPPFKRIKESIEPELSSNDTFGSPGSPPSSVKESEPDFINDFQSCIEKQDDELLRDIGTLPLEKRCEALTELFKSRTEVLSYFRDKVDAHDIEKTEIIVKCRKEVRKVRSFWKDKICYGDSRSGKMLKAALARNVP